jgi:hypothetical protein
MPESLDYLLMQPGMSAGIAASRNPEINVRGFAPTPSAP